MEGEETWFYSSSLLSSVSDPGDGGFQGDGWTRRPAALRCDLESGRENSQHGVSISEETHSSIKAARGVPDLP